MSAIVCIDDNVGVLEMYKAFFEANGHTVLTAPNGAIGIEISRKHPLDAVVLDLNMAGMSGNEFAEVLIRERPDLPVLICSGAPDNLPESLKWFADALVHKGDGPKALLEAVEKLVALRRCPKKCASSSIEQQETSRIAVA